MKIGNREFDVEHHTYVMGILNVTPDSFSDGGKWDTLDKALFHVESMVGEGAGIVDIGGESTRPGYTAVSAREEISRVVPVIEAVKSRFDIPVSLDTSKAEVAKAGMEAGADLINDIWGLKADPEMAGTIAESGLPCCLVHNRENAEYGNFKKEMLSDLEASLRIAARAGVEREKILLDPGVGFGKTYRQNLEAIRSLQELKALGCPILLGASRKSVIGLALGLPVGERLEGTLVTTVFGVLKGCAFVRVHDVRENVRAIRMTEAIMQSADGEN